MYTRRDKLVISDSAVVREYLSQLSQDTFVSVYDIYLQDVRLFWLYHGRGAGVETGHT